MKVTRKSVPGSMRERVERRKRLRAALGLAGMTEGDFALACKVTPGHLSMVLNGRRDSQRITDEIKTFVAKYLGKDAA